MASKNGSDWDQAYLGSAPAWVIGHAQPAIVELADRGLLAGRMLDVGCGTGEHAMLGADRGADAIGVDLSPLAITQATALAKARKNSARFAVADALNLAPMGETFDVVVDSGLFHVFDGPEQSRYAASLAQVVRPGGAVYITCICDEQLGEWGPHRVSELELRETFQDGWTVEDLRICQREINRPEIQTWSSAAWLATLRRANRQTS